MPRFVVRTALFLCLAPALLPAQQLDHYDLVLFSLSQTPDGNTALGAPRFLTAFNRSGYNNQPAFLSDTELYLSVQLRPDTTQTDIYALQLSTRTLTPVTATAAFSEYSPTPMPDGRRFSAVRMDRDGIQQLWAYPIDRSNAGKALFPAINNVGYHCWLKDTLAALFLVGEPHILVVVGTKGQRPVRIATDPGRCLQRTPEGKLVYVQKATAQTWFLKVYDPQKKTSEIIAQTLPGSEDFVLLPDGSFLAGSGAKLYRLLPGAANGWKEIADLKQYDIHAISRMAVSKDGKLAMVVK